MSVPIVHIDVTAVTRQNGPNPPMPPTHSASTTGTTVCCIQILTCHGTATYNQQRLPQLLHKRHYIPKIAPALVKIIRYLCSEPAPGRHLPKAPCKGYTTILVNIYSIVELPRVQQLRPPPDATDLTLT